MTDPVKAVDALRLPETMSSDRWVLLSGGKEIGMADEPESVLYDPDLVHADAVHIAQWDPATVTTVLDALDDIDRWDNHTHHDAEGQEVCPTCRVRRLLDTLTENQP